MKDDEFETMSRAAKAMTSERESCLRVISAI